MPVNSAGYKRSAIELKGRSRVLREIAVLGWGSLIWDKRDLELSSRWYRDGPLLPIEYARISSGGRLTLVVVPGLQEQRTLWAFSGYDKIDKAKENLKTREGTRTEYIGVWEKDITPRRDPIVVSISKWAAEHGLAKVIWSSLPPLDGSHRERPMSAEEALVYLSSLPKEAKKKARQYIVRTPEQINTELRKVARAKLGWRDQHLSKRFFELST